MKTGTHTRVATKLMLGFGSVVALMILSGCVAYWALTAVVGKLNDIKDDNVPKISWINSVNYDVLNIARSLRNGLLEIENPEKVEAAIKHVLETRAHIKETIGKLQTQVTDAESQASLAQILDARLSFIEGQDKVIALLRAQKSAEAKTFLLTEMRKRQSIYAAATENFQKLQEKRMNQSGAAAETQVSWALSAISGTLIIAALLSALIAWRIIRDLTRQLGGEPAYAANMVAAIAAGDLTQPVQVKPGDHESMLYAVKTMQDNLSELVAEIRAMVAAAADGDFSQRIPIENKQGFGLQISQYLNQLSEITNTGLSDVMRVAQALAGGDLGTKIEQTYPGIFGLTSEAINTTVDALRAIVAEIESIVQAASLGDFSNRISMQDKKGFGQSLGLKLNELSETTESGLRDIIRVTSALAEGNLTEHIDQPYPGMFGETRLAINTTIEQLTSLVQQIQEATQSINTAASEIAAGNQDLSNRTEEQASSLEETASSMEELNATVKNNASNASKANLLAAQSNQIAHESNTAMQGVISTMGDIQASSSKIAEIIGVIDSIAFQTNILALNAAVEAARAGEKGRGFAVVASEVRNLAKRSTEAAKQIKTLISESVHRVNEGGKLVQQTGSMMGEVIRSFEQVTHLATDIAHASNEQSTGIDQITIAVAQMDEVTQQNAALVEQAAAAAASLEEQAKGLNDAVAIFKLATNQRQETPLIKSHGQRALSGELLSAPTNGLRVQTRGYALTTLSRK